MKFVTGGAYEGKTEFAMDKYRICPEDITDAASADEEEMFKAVCIKNYQDFIKRILAENPEEFTQKLISENPDAVIIMNETGSGIIPLEKSDRIWREQTGRCGCMIAKAADEVFRVCCGIGVKIK